MPNFSSLNNEKNKIIKSEDLTIQSVEGAIKPEMITADDEEKLLLLSMLFDFKNNKIKGLSKLKSVSLISLSKLFDLPYNNKNEVLKEQLSKLSIDIIKAKHNDIRTNVSSSCNN